MSLSLLCSYLVVCVAIPLFPSFRYDYVLNSFQMTHQRYLCHSGLSLHVVSAKDRESVMLAAGWTVNHFFLAIWVEWCVLVTSGG